jgi:serine/threonine protein phosphatase PrpC
MGFAAGNAQHIGARPQQQDAFGFSDPSEQTFVAHGGFLGVVADGVGGLTHGSEASQSAVRTFLQAYHDKSVPESIPDALERSLLEANRAVLRVAGSNPSAEGVGTTLVAAVLHERALYWISSGDSRIYLINGTRLTRITSDHTYARELDEQAAQGLISRAEAHNHAERGALTSYLGQAEPKEIDRNTRPLAIQPNDCVILCTDGFYRGLNELEITDAFRGDLQRSCDLLVRQVLAKHRKQQDNLTVIALTHASKTRKPFAQGRGYLRSHARSLALAALILILLSAGAGYWYEKHSAGAGTAQEPPKPTSGSTTNAGAASNETNPAHEESTPVATEARTTKPAITKPAITAKGKPAGQKKPEQTSQGRTSQEQKSQQQTKPEPTPPTQDSTEIKTETKGETKTGTKTDTSGTPPAAPAGAPDAAPQPSAPPDGAVPPVTQPAAADEKTPPSPPAASDGKTPPAAPAAGSGQEKQPPPPPTAPETKPDAPPNRTLGRACGSAPRSSPEEFRADGLSRGLAI